MLKSIFRYLLYRIIEDDSTDLGYNISIVVPEYRIVTADQQEAMYGMRFIKQEIKILKQEVDYDDICKEIHEDMKAKGFLS